MNPEKLESNSRNWIQFDTTVKDAKTVNLEHMKRRSTIMTASG